MRSTKHLPLVNMVLSDTLRARPSWDAIIL